MKEPGLAYQIGPLHLHTPEIHHNLWTRLIEPVRGAIQRII